MQALLTLSSACDESKDSVVGCVSGCTRRLWAHNQHARQVREVDKGQARGIGDLEKKSQTKLNLVEHRTLQHVESPRVTGRFTSLVIPEYLCRIRTDWY